MQNKLKIEKLVNYQSSISGSETGESDYKEKLELVQSLDCEDHCDWKSNAKNCSSDFSNSLLDQWQNQIDSIEGKEVLQGNWSTFLYVDCMLLFNLSILKR